MNATLNGWLLVHWLPGAAVAVFGLALEDTLPTAPTATALTIVKATKNARQPFHPAHDLCLLSGRPPRNRRPSPSLRRPGRPESPARFQGCKLYERVYRVIRP